MAGQPAAVHPQTLLCLSGCGAGDGAFASVDETAPAPAAGASASCEAEAPGPSCEAPPLVRARAAARRALAASACTPLLEAESLAAGPLSTACSAPCQRSFGERSFVRDVACNGGSFSALIPGSAGPLTRSVAAPSLILRSASARRVASADDRRAESDGRVTALDPRREAITPRTVGVELSSDRPTSAVTVE